MSTDLNLPLASAILDHLDEAVVLTDQSGTILYTNSQWNRMFGHSPNEMIGEHITIVNKPDHQKNRAKIRELLKEVEISGTWEGVFYNQHKNGRCFNAHAKTFKIELDKQIYLLTVQKQVTAEDRVRTELHETKTFLNRTIDHMPLVFFAKTIEGRYIYVNNQFERFIKRPRSEIIGKFDQDLFEPELANNFRKNDQKVIDQKETIVLEERVINYAGDTFTYQSHKFPYLDSNGEVYAIGGISINLTEQKETEAALEESRLLALRASKMASLGEMASGIAHEVNNPLAAIQGFSRQLGSLMENDYYDPKLLKHFAQRINGNVERISKIIHGLRSFARDGEKDPYKPETVLDLISHVVELCQERLKNHGIDLIVPKLPDDIKICCRGVQIEQVLLNLINNAHDAILHLNPRWIKISVEETGKFVNVAITDSGKGIPSNIREEIFRPFFTSKPVGHGTGLGLSISKGLVEEHEGKLYIDESNDHTSFVVALPTMRSDD